MSAGDVVGWFLVGISVGIPLGVFLERLSRVSR